MPSRTRVLLVESDRASRAKSLATIRSQGYTVTEADSGWRAVEIATRADPDMIVMDVHLRDMSGIDAAQTILGLSRDSDPCIIFLTDDEHLPNVLRGLDLGPVDYLKRPFSPPELTLRLMAGLRLIRLQEAVNQREIAYRLLRKRSSDIVMILERDLSIAYVNRAAQSFMRESATTLKRRTLVDLLGKETSEHVIRTAQRILGGRDWKAAEFRSSVTVRGGTGAPREIRISVHPLGDVTSPVTQFIIIGQIGDIVDGPAVHHAA